MSFLRAASLGPCMFFNVTGRTICDRRKLNDARGTVPHYGVGKRAEDKRKIEEKKREK